jgi:ATP-binding cassette subfamily F protein 3
MLTVNSITKSFATQTVLSQVSFTLNRGERIALVGANGSGKTTLLRILASEEKADSGRVSFTAPGIRLGYLPQGQALPPGETVGAYIGRQQGDLHALEGRLAEISALMATRPGDPALEAEFDHTLEELNRAAAESRSIPQVMAGLGLGDIPPERMAEALSGGQKTRLALAGLLLAGPNLLLLDEPTNHLDLDMLEWLENWLLDFRGAALVVSHDRAFIDHVSTSILELDAFTHTLRRYDGNYSDYMDRKRAEFERQREAFSDQREEVGKLKAAAEHLHSIARFKRGGKADNGDKFAKGFFANRSLNTVARARQIEDRIERLNTGERIDKPRPPRGLKIEFEGVPESSRRVVLMENLAVGYAGKAVLGGLNRAVRYGERLVVSGPNGCGKTTLLRTAAGQLPPVEGLLTLGSAVVPGYMAQGQEDLDPSATPLSLLLTLTGWSETAARTFLSKYLFEGDDVFTPVPKLSYGERTRLSLAALVGQGCNLLLLDEPLNHLDIPAKTRFEEALSVYSGTIIMVTHDRYFIERFATDIWRL